MKDVLTVERVIAAPPDRIFDLLADPRRHRDLDGSGTVHDAKDAPARLTLGATFGMSMRRVVPYSMASTVVEFEENRRIAWQTRGAGRLGSLVGGRIWRYELEPIGDGSHTRVRESWDLSQERTKHIVHLLYAARTRRDMEATLTRIAGLVAA